MFLNIKKIYTHKIAKISLLIIGLLFIVAGFAGTYYFYNKSQDTENLRQELSIKLNELEAVKNDLQTELDARGDQISRSNEDIAAKDAKIKELEQQIQDLNKKIAGLVQASTQRSGGRSGGTGAVAQSPPSAGGGNASATPSGTIYDRIQVSDGFRPQVVRALDMIKANDGHAYGLLNAYVESINEMSGCGGYQVKKPIYVGSCGGLSPDYEIAAIIVHETTHIENVYVKRIYSVGTKAQELPAYQRQYEFAAKVGAPQSYLDFVQTKIDQYAALPN